MKNVPVVVRLTRLLRRRDRRPPFLESSPLTKGLVGSYDRLQLAAYTGDQLLLNVDAYDGGEATVEVLDEDMKPIRNFELSSSVPLLGRSVEQIVRWTRASWSDLSVKKVRLRIRLRNADLYSFWTDPEP